MMGRRAISVALAMLLQSCAVLTVDVDVYKGPLINHPKVLVEQASVMAIAAKPILTQLRDQLENEERGVPIPVKRPTRKDVTISVLPQIQKEEGYTTSHLRNDSLFQDEYAKHINRILELYDDIDSPKDGRLEKGLNTLVQEYLSSPRDEKGTVARDILIDALVRFAEQVRLPGNFSPLIAKRDARGDDSGTRQTSEKFVRLLQAVGNSILFEVDEIRESQSIALAEKVSLQAQSAAALSANELTKGLKPEALQKGDSPRSVLDQIIAKLNYLYIDAVANDGKDCAKAKQLNEAIRVAYEYRSGMTLLRPAAAYLRTSYPATTLQSDIKDLDRNMVRDMFASVIFTFYKRRDIVDITRELDKQYWQNINQIKLAGGGSTNYAVVKDDIGNWYVKSYSGNPDEIISSIEQLALFASTPGATVPGLIQGALAGTLRTGEVVSTLKAANAKPPSIELASKADALLAAKTSDLLAEILRTFDELKDTIDREWRNSIDRDSYNELSRELKSMPGPSRDFSDVMSNLLELRAYEGSLRKRILQSHNVPQSSLAIQSAAKVIHSTIERIGAKRTDMLKGYREQILLLTTAR